MNQHMPFNSFRNQLSSKSVRAGMAVFDVSRIDFCKYKLQFVNIKMVRQKAIHVIHTTFF